MLSRRRVQPAQQTGQSAELALATTRPTGIGDRAQLTEDFAHLAVLTRVAGARGQFGHHEAEVAHARVVPVHLFLRDVECQSDGTFHTALAEPKFDRLVQRRDTALQQVADLGDLAVVHLPEQVGQ